MHIDVAGVFSTFVYDGASMSDEQFAAWARGIRNQSRVDRGETELVEVAERGRPTIDGPIRVEASGPPPVFRVTAGVNRYFAVEVATEANLLRAAAMPQRTPQTFYASWSDPHVGLSEAMPGKPTIFALPERAWAELGQHSLLYYRVLTTSDRSADWPNLLASTRDDQCDEAPRMRIVDRIAPRVEVDRGRPAPASFLTSHAVDDHRWSAE